MDNYSTPQPTPPPFTGTDSQNTPPPYTGTSAAPTQDNTQLYAESVVLTERMKAAGVSNAVIYDMLIKKGVDGMVAQKIIDTSAPAGVEEKKDGRNDMIVGGLWIAGGLVITIGSYMMVKDGGGRYLITYGPIIYGIIRFFKGVAKM